MTEDMILCEDNFTAEDITEDDIEDTSQTTGPQEEVCRFFRIDEKSSECRLDSFLCGQLEDCTRSFIQKLIARSLVTVNGKPAAKSGLKLKAGDLLAVTIPAPRPLTVEAQDIPLDILYEDEDVILINKPKGMVVHPAAGHMTGTVVNALLYHCRDSLSGINGILRPGIVHRIDMDTTGVIIACKNDAAHSCIARQLKEHTVTRRYYAIVHGRITKDGFVDAPIGRDPGNRKRMAVNPAHGKEAVTHYHVVNTFHSFTWIECRLETGRTHQIRVHMASIGHPLLGDPLYGPSRCPYSLQGQTLHAYILGFVHPRTHEYMEFTAELPEYFLRLLDCLG